MCLSGVCLPDAAGALKYCRVCTNDSHCTKTDNHKCYDNLWTGFIKKCCKKVGTKLKDCYSKSPEITEREIDTAIFVEGYTEFDTGGCSGRNELGSYTLSLHDCSSRCKRASQCVSFEYSKSGSTCQLSTTCNDESLTVQNSNDPYHWYLKTVSVSVYRILSGFLHLIYFFVDSSTKLHATSILSLLL